MAYTITHTKADRLIAGIASDQGPNPVERSETISLSRVNLLYANKMALNSAIGKITPRKVGSSNILKYTKVLRERPLFTIKSTNLSDCVSHIIAVRLTEISKNGVKIWRNI